MSKNACGPARIYSPGEERWLFLGASITSFNASIGWNDQASEIHISLVEDPCEAPSDNPKRYLDANFIEKTTTTADPGFIRPILGSPAMFKLGDFEYTGIVTNWTQTNSESGNPTFEVTLTDPREILAGCQLIIGDYAGQTFTTPNVFNVYGLIQLYGNSCPARNILGAVFGAPGNFYGAADITDNGLSWNQTREAIHILTSSIPINPAYLYLSQYGRIIYRGNTTGGYGSFAPDLIDVTILALYPNQTPYQSLYFLDLSEIPGAPPHYRLSGTNISILDAINQVCDDAGCDYYLELVPVRLGQQIIKIIKLRIAVRGSQPALGQIELFIEEAGNVISKNVGRELRNETTSQFLIGGNVDQIYQADEALLRQNGLLGGNENIIIPYWGLDRNKNIIPTFVDGNGQIYFTIDLISLNTLLYEPLGINSATIHELELQAALTGQDAWLAWASGAPTDLGSALSLAGVIDVNRIIHVLNRIGFPHHLIAPGKKAGPDGIIDFTELEAESRKLKDIETVYNFVLGYARDYYGKKYLVRVPYTCHSFNAETGQITSTEVPTDSGWTEYSNVIGLPNPSFTTLFRNDENKITTFVRYDQAETNIEISNISEEDYILFQNIDNSRLFLKADILFDHYVYSNYQLRTNPCAVIELPTQILQRLQDDDVHRVKAFVDKFFVLAGVAGPDMAELHKKAGNSLLNLGIAQSFRRPDAVALPLHSNVLTYGPWYAWGPPGQTNILKDDGLVPWKYGSVANMNTAALTLVQQGVTYMQVVETGSVTVPGYPIRSLGDELRFGGQTVFETRDILTSNPTISNVPITIAGFSAGAWAATFGPNITNISVDIGEQGVTTTYTMRTYTPKFGRFSKRNADKLKEYNAIIDAAKKQARLTVLGQLQIQSRREGASKIMSGHLGNVLSSFAASPPGVLIGQVVTNDDNIKNTAVYVMKHNELVTEIEEYDKKAMMSLDGLLRPVSRSGSGGLPKYASHNTGCAKNIASSPEPPVNDYTPLEVSQTYLDPWAGPNDNKHADSLLNYDGHDIDIIARGEEIPDNLSVQLDDSYTTDYRGLALKGPLLLQSWGYDTQGKPIPNAADTEGATTNGTFKQSGLHDKFLPGFLRKPNTWPVAPVDLRFDRKRGVWVAPQPYRGMLRITLQGELTEEGTEAIINDGNAIENATGTTVTKTITVYPVSPTQNGSQGDKGVAFYDSVACRYYVLQIYTQSSGLLVGKVVATPIRMPTENYDSVAVKRCSDLEGTEIPKLPQDLVLLPHVHFGAFYSSDLVPGDIIIYGRVALDFGGEPEYAYVCLTDYTHEHSIFLSNIGNRSVFPNYTDIQGEAKFADDEVYNFTIKNYLAHPILEGRCAYVYRHKERTSQNGEYWLLQGEFGQARIVSDISIDSTKGNAIRGGEIDEGVPPGEITEHIFTSFSQPLYFAIRDKVIYLPSAWQIEGEISNFTQIAQYIDVDVAFACCSVDPQSQNDNVHPAKLSTINDIALRNMTLNSILGSPVSNWEHRNLTFLGLAQDYECGIGVSYN